MRRSFVRAALQRSNIRLSSLTEAVREARLTKDSLADDEPSLKRCRIKQKQPNDDNPKETVRTIREQPSSLEGNLDDGTSPLPKTRVYVCCESGQQQPGRLAQRHTQNGQPIRLTDS